MGFEQQLHEFEDRWQERWDEEAVFEPEPDDREKFFITVAYPYPSGGMHIGHVGTYTLPDVFARFKRMQGYNVLFPMGWHVTGTPIIGAVNRLKAGEEDQIQTLTETYNIPREDLEQLETPMGYAEYFIEDYRQHMQDLGFGVDWRRQFTTNDERYNRFIEWQYRTLREKDLVRKGKHPTKYCLDDDNPVTTHDLLEGEDAEKQDYTLVLFQGEDAVYPMATLRPETVFGATHTLVDPDGDYVRATVDGETWIIAADAVAKLRHQDHDVTVEEEIDGAELVGAELQNPITGDTVPMLPASFVDTASGSGLVMSVPAHAPYDWISLQDLKERAEELTEYGIDPEVVRDIEPITIIDVEGYGDVPAQEACEERGIRSQDEEDALEDATDEIYKKEHHTGTLNSNCLQFAGQTISEAKDELRSLYEDQGRFAQLWDFPTEVVCRCGGQVVVAETDTWFLAYDEPGWKDRADSVLNQLTTIPEGTRDDYSHTINWLESWPCIRNYGLGTKLPFDEEFVVEPLSDSTVYMAYYTIKHLIEDIPPERLTQEFFDYVFRGQGPKEAVAEETGVDHETLQEVRDSFEYWYPLDWRTSANELIQNHLTFFMFHHAALFDEQHWPQGIATWGMGLLEGKKMSSSKGHVVLPGEAIEEYGADTVRFFMFSSREPWQDFDWREDEVTKMRDSLREFHDQTMELWDSGEDRELRRIDRYMRSRLQRIIQDATDSLEEFQTRKASLKAFYELNNELTWYQRRTDSLHEDVVREIVSAQVRMMAPFIPHLCEQLWDETGHRGLVAEADWPEPEEGHIDEQIEQSEQLLKDTLDDAREITELVGDFDEMTLVLAADWKREAVRRVAEIFEETGSVDVGDYMDQLMSDTELRQHGEELSELVQTFAQNPGRIPDHVGSLQDERETFQEAASFIERVLDCELVIEPEDISDHSKASRARPMEPAIILE